MFVRANAWTVFDLADVVIKYRKRRLAAGLRALANQSAIRYDNGGWNNDLDHCAGIRVRDAEFAPKLLGPLLDAAYANAQALRL